MKEIRDKILRRWWAFPLFTIGFGLILSVGITNSWANGWLWMWLCLIVFVSVVQLYIMLQCIKEHEWLNAFIVLLLLIVSLISFFFFFTIAIISDPGGLPMQAIE